MGKTRYTRISKVLNPIVGKKISLDKLQRRVMIEIGSSGNIVKESIGFMMSMGLIRETSHLVFEVISDKADI